ncbi:phage portal protein [Hwanghaeella sp.]|uniref:phage portal protein n=1 Tax=Hwanghaeella sp. TaxID=2605943 RepID=UPI003CCC03AA
MNLFRKAAAYVVRKLSLTDPAGWQPSSQISYSGETVNETNVLGISSGWACVNLLAGTIASLPLGVYKEDGKGGIVPHKSHRLHRLLHSSPNADQTALEFWEFVAAAIELRGNAYARKVMVGSQVAALEPILAPVTVDRMASGKLRYRWTEDGKAYELPQEQVLHFRGFGGNALGGLSTLAMARNVFGIAIAADRAAGGMFKNGMRSSIGLTYDEFLTPEQRSQIENGISKDYAGAMNSGKPFINEGGAKIEQLSFSPEDAQMLESRGFSVEEVCRWFGVPPHMVGHTTNSTSWGSGLEEQVLGFLKFSLRRRVKRIEQRLAKDLLTPTDIAAGVSVSFNLDALLRGDSKTRAEFYSRMLQSGVFTINEVRRLESLPPVDGGDVPRMQSQNVPIDQANGIGHNGGPALTE